MVDVFEYLDHVCLISRASEKFAHELLAGSFCPLLTVTAHVELLQNRNSERASNGDCVRVTMQAVKEVFNGIARLWFFSFGGE